MLSKERESFGWKCGKCDETKAIVAAVAASCQLVAWFWQWIVRFCVACYQVCWTVLCYKGKFDHWHWWFLIVLVSSFHIGIGYANARNIFKEIVFHGSISFLKFDEGGSSWIFSHRLVNGLASYFVVNSLYEVIWEWTAQEWSEWCDWINYMFVVMVSVLCGWTASILHV